MKNRRLKRQPVKPDMVSQLGYSSNSPFNAAPMNQIRGDGSITMQNTRREILAFGQNGGRSHTEGRTLQPGQQYQMGPNVTEMPPETLFELEPQLLEIHLGTLSKKDQMVFIEKYEPLSENMKKAALMQMFQKYQSKIIAPTEESMQSGGYFQKPNLLPLISEDSVIQRERGYVPIQPIQQINHAKAFLQFADEDLAEARRLRRIGDYEGADKHVANVFAGEAMSKRMAQTPMLPRPMQTGGDVPQWNKITPPTEGYIFHSITSNRPVPENTVDMVKVPQDTKRPTRTKSATPAVQPVVSTSAPNAPATPMAMTPPQIQTVQSMGNKDYSFGATQRPVVVDSRGNVVLLPWSDTARTVWSTSATAVYTPAEPRERPVFGSTGSNYVADSRVERVDVNEDETPRDYSNISHRFEVVGDTNTSHNYYVVQDTKTGDFYRRNKKTGLYTPHTGALPKNKK